MKLRFSHEDATSGKRELLADSTRRGEDLDYNYRLATALAPHRCVGCARYHVNWTLARLVGLSTSFGSDKDALSDAIGKVVQQRSSSPGPITMTVLGCADTRMLALLAYSAHQAGVLERSRFVVLDRCDTPLQQCRDYAVRNGIDVSTIQVDVIAPDLVIESDILVVHSLLRFIDRRQHEECLKRWSGWLRPDGRLVFSNAFASQAGAGGNAPHDAKLRALVETNQIELAEPKEAFLERLDLPDPWVLSVTTKAELLALFSEAGLNAVWIGAVGGAEAGSGRLVAVLEATAGERL